MKIKDFKKSFALSFMTHFLLLGAVAFLVYYAKKEMSLQESGGGKGAVWIDLEAMGTGFKENNQSKSSSVQANSISSEKSKNISSKNDAIIVRQKKQNSSSEPTALLSGMGEGSKNESNHSLYSGQGSGSGLGSGAGEGASTGSASPSILSLIRKKIEQSKRYPALARARKIEGGVILNFSIQPSGSPEEIALIKSSGYDVLDQEAFATVRRAGPFPYYSQPIRISIKFSLDGES